MLTTTYNVESIRNFFRTVQPDETGMLELLNVSFVADETAIFGTVNQEWNARELQWYKSQSLSIQDIPAPIPSIWRSIASTEGNVNSNYGWCIWSKENGSQYDYVINTLKKDRYSRQGNMIYTRPSIHTDSTRLGMKDMICTYSTQLFIRNDKLYYFVYMRSNDAIFGYKGDKAWHDYVHAQALTDLRTTYPTLELGEMIWNAASLHVYPRHAHLVV
jgi:thymidylate synthase